MRTLLKPLHTSHHPYNYNPIIMRTRKTDFAFTVGEKLSLGTNENTKYHNYFNNLALNTCIIRAPQICLLIRNYVAGLPSCLQHSLVRIIPTTIDFGKRATRAETSFDINNTHYDQSGIEGRVHFIM